jgi:hypothetical protein
MHKILITKKQNKMLETKVTRDLTDKMDEHDWSENALYYYSVLDLYVLSNGKHDNGSFAGTCLNVGKSSYKIGHYSDNWAKDIFVLVTEDITVAFKSVKKKKYQVVTYYENNKTEN